MKKRQPLRFPWLLAAGMAGVFSSVPADAAVEVIGVQYLQIGNTGQNKTGCFDAITVICTP